MTRTQDQEKFEEGFGDPTPVPENASPSDRRKYHSEVHKYSRQTLAVFKECQFTGEELWTEFTC